MRRLIMLSLCLGKCKYEFRTLALNRGNLYGFVVGLYYFFCNGKAESGALLILSS